MVFGLFRRRSPDTRTGEGEPSPRDGRPGPEAPPPRSKNSPGIRVLPSPALFRTGTEGFAAQSLAGDSKGAPRALIVSVEPGAALPFDAAWAAVVLSGTLAGPLPAAAGDFLTGDAAGARLFSGGGAQPAYLMAQHLRGAETSFCKVGRDDLFGTGFRGIAGIRAIHRGPDLTVIRMGPPPGARWVIVGLCSLAVLSGKLTLIDGETPHTVIAGQCVLVTDPAATLYLQAGNDSALALGFAGESPAVALG